MPQRRARPERGAVLVITAISMVAMMCFAGLAIDVGLVRSQRAQYQATADAAALYATYLIRQPGATVDDVALKVKVFIAQNVELGGATGDESWRNCDDARNLPTVGTHDRSIANECISFDIPAVGNDRKARVRLPMRRTKPLIGLGLATMDVTAVAGADGSGGGCDSYSIVGCPAPTTTAAPTTTRASASTTIAPTTTRVPGPTTTRPTTTRPTTTRPTTTRPTTTRPTTTRPTTTRPTTTRPTTTVPGPTTTRAPATTTSTTTSTTAPPTPTTLDIGF